MNIRYPIYEGVYRILTIIYGLYKLHAYVGVPFGKSFVIADSVGYIAYSPVYRTCGNACIGGKVSV